MKTQIVKTVKSIVLEDKIKLVFLYGSSDLKICPIEQCLKIGSWHIHIVNT